MDDDPLEYSKEPDLDWGLDCPDVWGPDSGYKPYPPRFLHSKPTECGLRRPLALTQTCKQIRAEYRPFWLSHSRFQTHIDELDNFIQTFYPTNSDLQLAPQELYIAYPYDMYSQPAQPLNLTLLIRLHAYCPTFICKFRPAEMLEHHRKCCPYKYCVPWHCQFERDYKYNLGLMDYMAYTEAYRSFVMNSNDHWIEDAKNDAFNVCCSFDDESGDTEFHIRLKRVIDKGSDLEKEAHVLLKRWGMGALEYAQHMSFTLDFEIHQGKDKVLSGFSQSTREVVKVPSSGVDCSNEWFTYTQHYL